MLICSKERSGKKGEKRTFEGTMRENKVDERH
jgi:hypothetical protein